MVPSERHKIGRCCIGTVRINSVLIPNGFDSLPPSSDPVSLDKMHRSIHYINRHAMSNENAISVTQILYSVLPLKS